MGIFYIQTASPWENGYVESFNGKLRDELLKRELCLSLGKLDTCWTSGGWTTITVGRTLASTGRPRGDEVGWSSDRGCAPPCGPANESTTDSPVATGTKTGRASRMRQVMDKADTERQASVERFPLLPDPSPRATRARTPGIEVPIS